MVLISPRFLPDGIFDMTWSPSRYVIVFHMAPPHFKSGISSVVTEPFVVCELDEKTLRSCLQNDSAKLQYSNYASLHHFYFSPPVR